MTCLSPGDFRFCPVCAAELAQIGGGPDADRPACPSGHFVHYDNPAVTTFAFVEDDGKFLALRRADAPEVGEWDLPGGFVESGETPDGCVRREIAEETGLEVMIKRVVGAYAGPYGDGGKWTVDIGYLCVLAGGELTLSPEKTEAIWVSLDDFPDPAFCGERGALADLRAHRHRGTAPR